MFHNILYSSRIETIIDIIYYMCIFVLVLVEMCRVYLHRKLLKKDWYEVLKNEFTVQRPDEKQTV